MTERLFELDSYAFSFDACVLSCTPEKDGRYLVVLDRTGFFPEGGGQACDLGTLDGARVLDVQEDQEMTIRHTVERAFAVGQRVHGEIDCERRLDLMQQHTGEHILSSAFYNLYGAKNIGFHLGERFVMIHLDQVLTAQQVDAAEELANRYIQENHTITTFFPSGEEYDALEMRKRPEGLSGRIRIVRMEGVECIPCCGTHCRTTAGAGMIKVFGFIHYKGGIRVTMAAGLRAYRECAREHDILTAVANGFSTAAENVPANVDKLREENAALRASLKAANGKIFQGLCETLWAQDGIILYDGGEMAAGDVNQLLEMLVKRPGVTACIFSRREGRLFYSIGASKEEGGDARSLCQEINRVFAGKGGGNAVRAQGSAAFPQDFSDQLTALRQMLAARR